MFIELCKNNGIPYLRLVQSYRVEDRRGRKVSRKRTILNIGPLSRFDDGKPDFVQRLKDSYKKGTPIIDSLLPYVEAPVPSMSLPLRTVMPPVSACPSWQQRSSGPLIRPVGAG